ncbi:10823_t:CDS:2, partial [Dentiscutata erythropus]
AYGQDNTDEIPHNSNTAIDAFSYNDLENNTSQDNQDTTNIDADQGNKIPANNVSPSLKSILRSSVQKNNDIKKAEYNAQNSGALNDIDKKRKRGRAAKEPSSHKAVDQSTKHLKIISSRLLLVRKFMYCRTYVHTYVVAVRDDNSSVVVVTLGLTLLYNLLNIMNKILLSRRALTLVRGIRKKGSELLYSEPIKRVLQDKYTYFFEISNSKLALF